MTTVALLPTTFNVQSYKGKKLATTVNPFPREVCTPRFEIKARSTMIIRAPVTARDLASLPKVVQLFTGLFGNSQFNSFDLN